MNDSVLHAISTMATYQAWRSSRSASTFVSMLPGRAAKRRSARHHRRWAILSAMRTSSASEWAPIFCITRERCTLTVFSVVPSWAPTCLLSSPCHDQAEHLALARSERAEPLLQQRLLGALGRGARGPARGRRATAASSASSETGFSRKSTAPPFIARTPLCTSARPLMKTSDSSMPRSSSSSWRSSPLRPGMLQVDDQAGRELVELDGREEILGRAEARSSRSPAARRTRVSARRTPASSSTR